MRSAAAVLVADYGRGTAAHARRAGRARLRAPARAGRVGPAPARRRPGAAAAALVTPNAGRGRAMAAARRPRLRPGPGGGGRAAAALVDSWGVRRRRRDPRRPRRRCSRTGQPARPPWCPRATVPARRPLRRRRPVRRRGRRPLLADGSCRRGRAPERSRRPLTSSLRGGAADRCCSDQRPCRRRRDASTLVARVRAAGAPSSRPAAASTCCTPATSRRCAPPARSATAWSSASTATSRCAGSRARPGRWSRPPTGCGCSRRWRCVDAVVVFDEDPRPSALDRLRPDVWAKGGDYAGAELPEAAVLRRWGGQAVVLPYVAGLSTTLLVDAVTRSQDRREEAS